MAGEGPFPLYSLIFCTGTDEGASTRVAAFPDDAAASDHARLRLLRLPEDYVSVVVAQGSMSDCLSFVGAWDRDLDGALRWEAASLA